MSPARLHRTIWISGLAGFAYIAVAFFLRPYGVGSLCIIRNVTGYPCPSCGVTSALKSLFRGKLTESLHTNPLALVIAILAAGTVIGLVTDYLFKRQDVYVVYCRIGTFIRRWPVLLLLISLTLINWIWNLCKFH